MTTTPLRFALSALALIMFVAPQGVFAICELPSHRLQVGHAAEGQKGIGGLLGLGEGQTTIGGEASLQVNPKWRARAGLVLCRIGSTELALGAKIDTELFRSEDAKIGVFAGGGFNRVSVAGTGTWAVPLSLYGTVVVTPLLNVFAGPSLTWIRTSNGVFSGSNTNLGFQLGVMYRVNETLCVVLGGDFQDFAGGTSTRLQTGVYLDVN